MIAISLPVTLVRVLVVYHASLTEVIVAEVAMVPVMFKENGTSRRLEVWYQLKENGQETSSTEIEILE